MLFPPGCCSRFAAVAVTGGDPAVTDAVAAELVVEPIIVTLVVMIMNDHIDNQICIAWSVCIFLPALLY